MSTCRTRCSFGSSPSTAAALAPPAAPSAAAASWPCFSSPRSDRLPCSSLLIHPGSRGYYLKGEGVLLNQALINCALQFGVKAGYTPVQTPFFMQARRAERRGASAAGRVQPQRRA